MTKQSRDNDYEIASVGPLLTQKDLSRNDDSETMKSTKNHITPPRLAEKLLNWFIKDELAEEVLGDLDEKFYSTLKQYSPQKAKRNYWFQVINYMRPFAFKFFKNKNSTISPMKLHFKLAFRLFRKNTLISFASLTSIVVGVFSTFLIYLWVNSEQTTDQFHTNYAKLYIPVIQQSAVDEYEPINTSLIFNADYSKYSEIDGSVQTIYMSPNRLKLSYNNEIYRGGGMITDSTFFDYFDFKLIDGNPNEVLKDPSNILLTQSMAKRIFGDSEPIGELIEISQRGSFQVAGILEDIPSNSSMTFDFVLPIHAQSFWGTAGIEFLLVNNSFDKNAFDEKIAGLGRNHPQFKESTLSTVAFSDTYFNKQLNTDLLSKHGQAYELDTMRLVALVILLVSILNFTNMQSTLSFSQLKAKSIKQIHGAEKRDFVFELVASRLVYMVFSIILTYVLFLVIKPTYLNFLNLTIDISELNVLGLISAATFVFIIATTLMALLQTVKISSVKALSGQLNNIKSFKAGKVLTTVQYVFAIALIIATGVIFKQFKYMQNKNLGFDKENLVSFGFFDRVEYSGDDKEFYEKSQEQKKNYDFVVNELAKIPGVEHFSQGKTPFDNSISGMPWKLVNSNYEYSEIKLLSADANYAETVGLKIIEGRFFSDSLDVQRQNKVVINKAAMEFWGIENLEDAKLASSYWGGEGDPYQVIGVVDNFHYEHLSRKIAPLIMVNFESIENAFTLKVQEERFKATMESVSELFQTFNPNQKFTYTVLEDKLKTQYEREKKLTQTFVIFTLIAVILSSIGLFTMALYETQKRIKEIGIRKVVGASTGQVIALLSTNFMKWVLLAFIIAWPIAWYLMEKWLDNFANQTPLSWWIFAGAGLTASILAMLTVIGQSFSAASQNPVKALRAE